MRAHFQLFCKCFGVVLMVGALLAVLMPIFMSFILPILYWDFPWEGFTGFLKYTWRLALTTIVTGAIPGALGFYLTGDDNMFVRMCFPDGGAPSLAMPPMPPR